jgi:hypothetical protein
MISRAERGYEATSVNVAESEHRHIPIGGSFLIERVASDVNGRPFVWRAPIAATVALSLPSRLTSTAPFASTCQFRHSQ